MNCISRTFLTKQDRLRLIKQNKAAPSHLRNLQLDLKENLKTPDASMEIPKEETKSSQTPTQSESLSSDNLLWYNDPYLVSKKVSGLLQDAKNVNEAIELVKRHKGASNAQVYGTLLKGMANLGLYSDVLKLYREVILSCQRRLMIR